MGDPKSDHKCWERPETMLEKRPETYASSLLDHAERLFKFADAHWGSYTRTFPELSAYYNSTTYQDELLWAAAWLYHATGNHSYLSYATGRNADEFADLGNPRYFS